MRYYGLTSMHKSIYFLIVNKSVFFCKYSFDEVFFFIERLTKIISKLMKHLLGLSLILLNHLITSSEFNHWVRFDFDLILSMWVYKLSLAILLRLRNHNHYFISSVFEITIDIGNTSTEFLDVSLDQSLNTYCPYCKPNSKTNYINNNSNHPKSIRNNIQKMVEKRLLKLT